MGLGIGVGCSGVGGGYLSAGGLLSHHHSHAASCGCGPAPSVQSSSHTQWVISADNHGCFSAVAVHWSSATYRHQNQFISSYARTCVHHVGRS